MLPMVLPTFCSIILDSSWNWLLLLVCTFIMNVSRPASSLRCWARRRTRSSRRRRNARKKVGERSPSDASSSRGLARDKGVEKNCLIIDYICVYDQSQSLVASGPGRVFISKRKSKGPENSFFASLFSRN